MKPINIINNITESEKQTNILDMPVRVYDINAFIDEEINKDSDKKYKAFDFDTGAAILVTQDGSGCIVDFEAVGSSFAATSDTKTVYICPKSEEKEGKKEIYIMPTASFKVTIDELLTAPYKEMKVQEFFTKHNYNDRCATNFANIKDDIINNTNVSSTVTESASTTSIKELAKSIENILKQCGASISYIDIDENNKIMFDCKLEADKISKYDNKVSLYGDLFFDENLKLVKADVMTSSGPNVLNYNLIRCLDALYSYFSSGNKNYNL